MTLNVSRYYNNLASLYDWLSPKSYYLKARKKAVKELGLGKGDTVLNVACGTGQNFELFQEYLKGTGLVIGIDFSAGMLAKAKEKIKRNNWHNIQLINGDANLISEKWLFERLNLTEKTEINASICDLGLSAIPNWENVLNRMIEVTKPKGKIVIMDWYMEKLSWRGRFINLVGKADIRRPSWQYLKAKTDNFKMDQSFNRGGVFVASGNKR